MVAFRFNARGFLFESGIDEINTAYTSSVRSFEQKLLEYDEEEIEIKKKMSADNITLDKDDELNEAEIIDYHRETAFDAIRLIREAFLVVLYHYWERSVQSWMGAAQRGQFKFNFETACDWIENQKLDIARDQLKDLRNLVNLIKHGNHNPKKILPVDLFRESEGRAHDDLRITELHVVSFFHP